FARRWSSASASSSASSARRTVTALSALSRSAMRSRAACTASFAETRRDAAACCTAAITPGDEVTIRPSDSIARAEATRGRSLVPPKVPYPVPNQGLPVLLDRAGPLPYVVGTEREVLGGEGEGRVLVCRRIADRQPERVEPDLHHPSEPTVLPGAKDRGHGGRIVVNVHGTHPADRRDRVRGS